MACYRKRQGKKGYIRLWDFCHRITLYNLYNLDGSENTIMFELEISRIITFIATNITHSYKENDMHFEIMILAIFSILGLINGSLWAFLFRKKYWYAHSILGLLIGGGAGGYFLWYAKGYTELGDWSLWLAYVLCGVMVAEIIMAGPFLVLSLVSMIRLLRPLARFLAMVTMVVALVIGVYGSMDGNSREKVERLDIYVEGLPAGFEGYKFAQLTDTHIGPYFRYTDLPDELMRAKKEGAKTVFFTGDLIDDVRFMPETGKTLTKMASLFPDGIFYVWGNHEYYRGKAGIREELVKTPVKLLENDSAFLSRGGQKIYLAGVDYPWSKGEEKQQEMDTMIEQAYAKIPAGAPSILLAHHSDFIDEGFKKGAFLTLTGHTHGTQFGWMDQPIITPFRYTRGMYSDGVHQGYVSRGDASWFPFRFMCPREMVIVTLHKKSS